MKDARDLKDLTIHNVKPISDPALPALLHVSGDARPRPCEVWVGNSVGHSDVVGNSDIW